MTVSTQDKIHDILQKHNPFNKPTIVREQDVWNLKNFVDVPQINAHVFKIVLKLLQKVQKSNSKVESLVITAPSGAGKTHFLRRVAAYILRKQQGLFIYASVAGYGNLNLVNSSFRQSIADSLEHENNQGVSQWQYIATIMFREAIKNPKISPKKLTQQFDKLRQQKSQQGQNYIDTLTETILQNRPGLDPYFVKAIFWTLSKKQYPYAMKYLAGEEIDSKNAKIMALPTNSNKSNTNRDAEAIAAIRDIFQILNCYQPIVVCFDELDVNRVNDSGLPTSIVIAKLVKDLFDTLKQTDQSKGIIFLTLMFPEIWRDQVRYATSAVINRVSTAEFDGLQLNFGLDGDEIINLISFKLKQELYQPFNITPPYPNYPFSEEALRKIGKERPTVREVFQWCANQINQIHYPEKEIVRFFTEVKEQQETIDVNDYIDDSAFVGNVLSWGFQILAGTQLRLEGKTGSGEQLQGATIEKVAEVKPKSKNSDWLNFQVIGYEAGKKFAIGVGVLQQDHGTSVGAGMKRLIDYKTFQFTRACLVRSKQKKFKRQWDSYDYLKQLMGKNGEWVDLQGKDLKPLLTLYFIYQQRETYPENFRQILDGFLDANGNRDGLTPAEKQAQKKIFAEIRDVVTNNELLREIVSHPSGKVDETAVSDDEE